MFLETIFPPIPSEVIMPIAGMRAAQGPLDLVGRDRQRHGRGDARQPLLVSARPGDRARALPAVHRALRPLADAWTGTTSRRSERLFGRFGGGIVFVGRMLPTIRSVISIPAGLLSMRLKRFLIWSTLGTAVWSAAARQRRLGPRQRASSDIEKVLGPLSTAVIVAIVVAYVWRQLTWRNGITWTAASSLTPI